MTAASHSDAVYGRARAAARLAAVQALYQMDISGRGASAVIAEFVEHRLSGEADGEGAADEGLFRDIVGGVVAAQDDIDAEIAATLADGWRLERLDSTARAILRCGAFEILRRADVPVRVIMDEYVTIGHAFFEGAEPKFVNGSLDALARRARPAELASHG